MAFHIIYYDKVDVCEDILMMEKGSLNNILFLFI